MWVTFLNSLGTRGGNLLILLVMNGFLFLAVLHVLHHGDKGDIASMVSTTFSTFSGALLHALYQGSKEAPTANSNSNPTSKENL